MQDLAPLSRDIALIAISLAIGWGLGARFREEDMRMIARLDTKLKHLENIVKRNEVK